MNIDLLKTDNEFEKLKGDDSGRARTASNVEKWSGTTLTGRDISEDLKRLHLIEFVHRLVGGNLTEDSIQWSSEVSTVDADTDYEVLNLTLDNGQSGDIHRLEFGLTLAIKAGSTTADVKYKWQARNKGGTWVDLHAYFTKADINTTYKEYTVSGYKFPATNLDSYPIDIRLVIQSNETTPGVATAKVKNPSYVQVELK